jgi:hypothetical protein
LNPDVKKVMRLFYSQSDGAVEYEAAGTET